LGDVAFKGLDRCFFAVGDGLVEIAAEELGVFFFPEFASFPEFREPSPASVDLLFLFFFFFVFFINSSSLDSSSNPNIFSNTEANCVNTLVNVGNFLSPIRTIDCTIFLIFTMIIDCSLESVDPPLIDTTVRCTRIQFELLLFSGAKSFIFLIVGFLSLRTLSDVKDGLICRDDEHDGRGDVIAFTFVASAATIKDSRRHPLA